MFLLYVPANVLNKSLLTNEMINTPPFECWHLSIKFYIQIYYFIICHSAALSFHTIWLKCNFSLSCLYFRLLSRVPFLYWNLLPANLKVNSKNLTYNDALSLFWRDFFFKEMLIPFLERSAFAFFAVRRRSICFHIERAGLGRSQTCWSHDAVYVWLRVVDHHMKGTPVMCWNHIDRFIFVCQHGGAKHKCCHRTRYSKNIFGEKLNYEFIDYTKEG